MKADARTEAAVMAVLDKFSDACARRNVEDVFGLFAPEHEHHAGDAGIPDHDDPGREDRPPIYLPTRQ